MFALVHACVSMLMLEMLAKVRTGSSSKDRLSNFSVPSQSVEGLNHVEFAVMMVSCCPLGDLFILAKQNTLGRVHF